MIERKSMFKDKAHVILYHFNINSVLVHLLAPSYFPDLLCSS